MTFPKLLAALLLIAALISLFVTSNIKVTVILITAGNLLSILDHFKKRS